MQFCKVMIDEFGKLNNEVIHFSPGINLIYGENESGKTTVHTFLRSMLFGMERGRGRAAATDDWSRFEPWEYGGRYGGSLIFCCGDRTFQIDRSFERNRKTERLFCLEDGEELSLEHGDLEMLLCQMTEKGYRNSVSLEQNQNFSREALAGTLRNQAANYSGSSSDNIDVAAAIGWLKNERKQLEKKLKEAEEEIRKKRSLLEQKENYLREEYARKAASYRQLEGELEDEPFSDEKVRRNPLLILVAVVAIALSMYFADLPWKIVFSAAAVALEEIWYAINKRGIAADHRAKEAERLEKGDQLWRKQVLLEDIRELETQIHNLSEEQAECVTGSDEYAEIKRKCQVYMSAEKRIADLSSDMIQEAGHSGNLAERMSDIIRELTDGKYEKVYLDEDMRCSVYTEGKKIPAESLSRGTLEQLLFALRMAAAEELYDEPMPVVLDDAFVFYDDERLGNTLEWLADNRQQVILFTCQSREEEMLRSQGIPYTKKSGL